jgi:thymidylate kinase
MAGRRIVVVGVDATGKDTIANAIGDRLASEGIDVVRRARWAHAEPRDVRSSDTKSRWGHVRQQLYFAAQPVLATPALLVGAVSAERDLRMRPADGTVELIVSWSPLWAAAHWAARRGRVDIPSRAMAGLERGAALIDDLVLVTVDEAERRRRIEARPENDESDRRSLSDYGLRVRAAHEHLASRLGATVVDTTTPGSATLDLRDRHAAIERIVHPAPT